MFSSRSLATAGLVGKVIDVVAALLARTVLLAPKDSKKWSAGARAPFAIQFSGEALEFELSPSLIDHLNFEIYFGSRATRGM